MEDLLLQIAESFKNYEDLGWILYGFVAGTKYNPIYHEELYPIKLK